MDIVLDNMCTLYDAPEKVRMELKGLSTFMNPEYRRRVSRGLYAGYLKKNIYLYTESDDSIALHRGMTRDAYELALKYNVKPVIRDRRIKPEINEPIMFTDSFEPYEYQLEAVDACFKRSQGILVSPAGSGKTVMGMMLAVLAETPVLWLTHKIELIHQTINVFKRFTNIDKKDIGIIASNKKTIGRKLTVATIQSINNITDNVVLRSEHSKDETYDIYNHVGCLVIDEAHHSAAETWQVISRFKAKYRFGLTATPYRRDELDGMLYCIIGRELHRITHERLIESNHIMKADVIALKREFKHEHGNDNNKLMKELIFNGKRNHDIAELTLAATKRHKQILILSRYIAHCDHLYDRLIAYSADIKGFKHKIYKLHSNLKFDYNRDESFILIATYGKAEEGLDMPTLEALVFATPVKNKKTVEQSIGRIERVSADKGSPIIYDIYDRDEFILNDTDVGGMLVSKWRKRLSAYGERAMTVWYIEDIKELASIYKLIDNK